jgi:hypothetical protein
MTILLLIQHNLKEFAKGDYLLYQKRNQSNSSVSIDLEKYKGQEIEAVTLLRLVRFMRKQRL